MHRTLKIAALVVFVSGLLVACGSSKSKGSKSTQAAAPVAKPAPEAKAVMPDAGPAVHTGPLDTIVQGRVLDPKTNVHQERNVGIREGRIVIVAEP